MKASSIITTALVLGAAGIIVATIFAPGKGAKNTRNRIVRKGKLYKDYLMNHVHELANTVSQPLETLEDEAVRLSKKTKANL